MLHGLQIALEIYLAYAAFSFLYCGALFALHLRRDRVLEAHQA